MYFRKGIRGVQPSLHSNSRIQQGSNRSGYVRSNTESNTRRFGLKGLGSIDEDLRGSNFYEAAMHAGTRKSYADSGESDLPLHTIRRDKKGFYVTEEVRAVSDNGDEIN